MKTILIEFKKVDEGQPFAIQFPFNGCLSFSEDVLAVGVDGGERFFYNVKYFVIRERADNEVRKYPYEY